MSELAADPGTERHEVVSVGIAAAPDAVWAALREPEQLQRWFGWDYDGLDAEIQQIFVESAIEGVDGDVRTLAWHDGDLITVAPSAAGTALTITRRGSHAAAAVADGPDQTVEGWLQFAQQLRFVFERSPRGERRTVSAIDLDGGPVGAGPVYRLGVAASDGVPVGGHWEVTRNLGAASETVGGSIWYRAHFQAGYTVVAPAGEALLVVRRVPVAQRPPHGRVNLVLSTYGLDDEAFGRVQRLWTSWWDGH